MVMGGGRSAPLLLALVEGVELELESKERAALGNARVAPVAEENVSVSGSVSKGLQGNQSNTVVAVVRFSAMRASFT